ncbi:T9SS type A sorting domain-containing protein [Hymenobacter sp.]|uniref:T9SS type A sorting domain-containing protein n=1 Tax=Hymenobacter sp. TaxID=1898978 RepID=UPI00286CC188|nr:PHB depolymerase family esterase [Hymenobacter sp.]
MKKLFSLLLLLLPWLPAAAQAPAPLVADSAVLQGVLRKWYTQLPRNYATQTAAPLLLALHGGLGTARNFAGSSGWPAIADTAGVIVVFPEGGIEQRPGGFVWNIYSWDATYSFYNSTLNDVAYLDTVMNRVSRRYRVDANRVYLMGFSNGSSMVNTYLFRNSARLAAAAPVSGSFMTTLAINPYANPYQPNGKVPVWIWRGQQENQQVPGTSETRSVSDQNQKRYWISYNQTGPGADRSTRPTLGGYTYADTLFASADCRGAVRFTEVAGQNHQFVPAYAARLWDEFFRGTVRTCVSQPLAAAPGASRTVLSVYPNPARTEFRLGTNQPVALTTLYNATGRAVPLRQREATYSLSGIGPGLYLLRVQFRDGTAGTQKLLVE